MSSERRFGRAGEESNADPFGRGCFPMTIMLGATLTVAGGIGWAIGDWLGLSVGLAAAVLAWSHLIWS
jgi:hypothetical protein